MDAELRALRLRQLDATLEGYRELRTIPRPRAGWIRSIRKALGMTAAQLAKRLGVTQPAVVALEKNEADDAITLGSLRRAARALDAELVYALVPNRNLRQMLEDQIRKLVTRQVGRVAHTMALEEQAVSDEHVESQIASLVEKLILSPPKNLWS